MSQEKKRAGRRTFLLGLLTGAGAVTALTGVAGKAAAKKEPAQARTATEPVLYRRTDDVERYYRTLYS